MLQRGNINAKGNINFLFFRIKHLFNRSIDTSVFVSVLKMVEIIPLFKAGDHNKLNNYRPISHLSPYC